MLQSRIKLQIQTKLFLERKQAPRQKYGHTLRRVVPRIL